jgi:hypothetical protein
VRIVVGFRPAAASTSRRASWGHDGGTPVDDDARQAAFADNAHTCHYGHILQTGLEYLRKAGQFWRRETEHLVAPNFDEWPIT